MSRICYHVSAESFSAYLGCGMFASYNTGVTVNMRWRLTLRCADSYWWLVERQERASGLQIMLSWPSFSCS